MSVDVSGIEEAVRNYALDRLAAAAELFVSGAQGRCSRRSGALADSIQVADPPSMSGDVAVCRVTAGEGLDYARYQDEGTGLYGPEGSPILPLGGGKYGLMWFDSSIMGVIGVHETKGAPGTHFWSDTVEDWPNILSSL